jgi:hypothetical protein
MTNCENDSRWLNENLPEFVCTVCYCKLEHDVDGELAELNVPEPRNMFETLPNEAA